MPIATGIVLAIITGLLGRLAGFDRDRAFYPTVVIATTSYYALFATMGGSTQALIVESIIVTGFACVAIVGFRSNLWLAVAALAGHGAFDLVHHRLVSNPGVPAWWPAFCCSFDVVLAGILWWLMYRGTLRAGGGKAVPAAG
jgi:hypothetical protein